MAGLLCAVLLSVRVDSAALSTEFLQHELYQDYKHLDGRRSATLRGKPVKLWSLPSLRIEAFDLASQELADLHRGQACVAGETRARASKCKPFRSYNPTILSLGQEVLLLARVSNWSLCDWAGSGRPYADFPETKWPHAVFEEYHSHIASLVLHADDILSASSGSAVAQLLPFEDDFWDSTRAPFFEIFRQGLEDPRLFSDGAEVRALIGYGKRGDRPQPTRLANEREERAGAFRQAGLSFLGSAAGVRSASLSEDNFVPLETDFDRQEPQKNWMPFVHMGRTFAIYQLEPIVKVLELNWETGGSVVAYETPTHKAIGALKVPVRGGSPCVHVPEANVFIGVAHISRGRSAYTHFLFALDDAPPFKIRAVSREWCLAHDIDGEPLCEGVQFVSGLALLPGNTSDRMLVMSYGVMDCDARLAQVPLNTALKALGVAKNRDGTEL